MFNNKLFWTIFMMPGAILGWLFIIFGLLYPIENELLRKIWIIIVCIWCIGHPLELILSIPIGKKAGISTGTVFLKTMLFGFTWWLPLKLGVLDK
ncbi:MAG: hypothetical protein APR62_07085 [Smithella sp. SDB]|nr:MAG: hypothetical protein APR62_07085 [Smithella sp. SDB]